MAAATKPTILILQGAFHLPRSYSKLTGALRTAGFVVHIPSYVSMNQSRPPNADLATDTDLIRSYATGLVEAGQDVAVLMHSYGGQVGTNALYGLSTKARSAKGLLGGISHLIYMAASASLQGKSIVDKAEEFGHLDRLSVAFDFDDDRTCMPNYPKEGFIGIPYADKLDQEELKDYLASLRRWNGECVYQPIENIPAWRDEAKICYIYALGDLTIPIDYQKSMVKNVEGEGKTVQTVELDTGHCPNLTETKAVVDAVLKFTSE